MTTDTIIKRPGWWNRRTHLEKTLFVFALMAALVIVGLSIGLIGIMSNSLEGESLPTVSAALGRNQTTMRNEIGYPNENKEKLCLTEGCIHSASFILKSLDQKVDPCEDFYSYACGGYISNSHIADDKSSLTRFNDLSDQLSKQLRVVLEEKEEPNQPHHVKLAKQLYKACMNTSVIQKRGLEPLLEMLKKLGGWPVLEGEKWDMGSFDWRETVYKFRRNGYSVDYIIDFSVSTDTKNSKQRIISLDQASLGLSREFLIKGLDDPFVSGYLSYMVDIAVIMGADKKRAEKELLQVLDFEMTLANISLPAEERRNGTKLYNPMTVNELQTNYTSIPWLSYLNSILPSESKVNNSEIIVITVPEYLRKLEPILAQTEKRVLANYLLWRAAAVTVPYLTEDVRKRQLQFATVLSGKTEREPRWHECVDVVSGGVSLSVGSLYVTRYFDDAAKQAALEIVSDIRTEMVETLNEIDWMDDITRKKGIEKAKSMAVHIGYPDELVDSEKLSKFYQDLHVDPNNYMESILNLTKFGTNFSFRRLRQPVNKTEWISHGRPAIVNAFYSSIENSIQFPAGILQGVFFDNTRPRFMNYGAIGFVIGHEITHGFDDQGRQFDSDGNLVDWWEPETKSRYLDKAKCIIYQYGNYTEPLTGLHLNGINTQGENIADNGGIRLAYNAYQKWISRQKEPEATLPGLPGLTPQKAFWLSAAQAWCSKYRKESMRNRVTTGVHSPGQFRVLGPLSNAPEFSRDYGCPMGTPMNPSHKCRVF